ncbi:MAG: hypothetical protein K9J38_10355 [Polynucleobacter sp.]|nr:hypothetical protein [Polynucleobacter sp.]
MLKKRLIFTLLYQNKHFFLSRNFRLQKIGNIDWLKKNYNFSKISSSIDELIILNVDRNSDTSLDFADLLGEVAKNCFVPIAAGGGIRNIDQARMLLRSGADKVVLNTAVFWNIELINELIKEFGSQSVVASVDIKRENANFKIFSNCGSVEVAGTVKEWFELISNSNIGELFITSIDGDGTGQGINLDVLELLPKNFSKPLILAGGIGQPNHFIAPFLDDRVDAVATANLLNFVGDGLMLSRLEIINNKIDIPKWNFQLISDIRNSCGR